MNAEWKNVVTHIHAMAELHGRTLSEAAARIFIGDLMPYPPSDVLEGLRRCRAEIPRFPTLAEIIARIPGAVSDDTLAIEAAARIVQGLSKFGPYRLEEARVFVGPLGWEVVRRQGGWEELCVTVGVDTPIGVFQSQAVKIAKSVLEQGRAGVLGEAPGLPESSTGLKSVGEIARGLLPEMPKGE